MKKNLLHIFIFTAVALIYIVSISIYGLKNITIYNILLFLFASPLLEEFIFRDIVQYNLQKYIKYTLFSYISLSNIITSVIFALSHYIAGSGVFVTILLIIPSIYLGLIYDKYGSIKYTVVAHSFFNIIVFIDYPNKIWAYIMKIFFIV